MNYIILGPLSCNVIPTRISGNLALLGGDVISCGEIWEINV